MVEEKKTLEIADENVDRLFEVYHKTKNIEIRNELVNKHLYIAEIIAKKFVGRGIDYEDLFQVACIALINAVERFEPKKGYKFTSFATPTIMGEIKRYFRDRASIIRLPRRIFETSAKIKLATEVLSTKLKRPPKIDEIACHLNMSPEEVLEVMEASNNYLPQSLDQTIFEDEEMTFGDVLGKSDENILQVENVEAVKKAIERLLPFEREFVQKRFFEEKTQKEIAEEMNVSQMYISRLEKKVLKKLKDFIEEKKEE